MTVHIHPSWLSVLAPEFEKPYWQNLTSFVKSSYTSWKCYPPGGLIFSAFDLAPFDSVKVIILWQDPYHTPGAAMGLCFSVPDGSPRQPSLRNIFQELDSDVGIKRIHTDLSDWAKQWVLLLNSVLTVEKWIPASHQWKGWEIFTDSVIHLLSESKEHLVFILWGNYAISKKDLIDSSKHCIITSPHPSPFSAHRGFLGSKPFSRTNEYLHIHQKSPVIWW